MNVLPERLPAETEVILNLTRELWVVKDRMHALEALLGQGARPSSDTVDAYRPDPELQGRVDAERDAYLKSVLAPLTRGDAT